MVSLAMSAGTLEYALSSFAFLGEAEALEDERTFWFWGCIFFGEWVIFCSRNRTGTHLGFCVCLSQLGLISL